MDRSFPPRIGRGLRHLLGLPDNDLSLGTLFPLHWTPGDYTCVPEGARYFTEDGIELAPLEGAGLLFFGAPPILQDFRVVYRFGVDLAGNVTEEWS